MNRAVNDRDHRIRREKHMARLNRLCSMLFLTGTWVVLFSSVLWAAEGIISKAPDSSGIYCNLKFPAIKEDTLTSNRPQLKDPSEGDIVDFYGPCDHNPLGKEEVQRQKGDIQREKHRQFGDQ
jgi:hypothetical protein